MNKKIIIWLLVASFLILIGCIIFAGVMIVFKWDFTKLATVKYETNEHILESHYINLSIVTDTADILLVPSESANGSVVCYEQENSKHSVTVKDGSLEIKIEDTRKWYEYIGIAFGTPKITVYIPQGEYRKLLVKSSTGDVEIPADLNFESIDISASTGNVKNYASASELIKIKTSTGAIRVENISAGALDLTVSTGKVTVSDVNCESEVAVRVSTGKTSLTDIECKSVISSGSTGDISLKNVIATEKLSLERSTGHVKFDGCDAGEIFVKTNTGDVRGTLLSDKVFITKTDTGDIDVPKTITGEKCEINTNTGDIKISISYQQ